MKTTEVLILGAGPAGLSCAYEHVRRGRKGIIIDKHPQMGGLSRTEDYKGYRFDVGPHRFFTKNEEIDRLWHEIGGDEIIQVKRLTRIVYHGKMFEYPLKPMQALFGLGFFTSFVAVLSYFFARFTAGSREPVSFEDWIVREFGRKLYEIFFKTYTEKVWGIPCSQIGAEWAAQRIKGLSLIEVMRNAVFGQRKDKVKSLVDSFSYPKHGAGRVYERMGDHVIQHGFEINLRETVEEIRVLPNGEGYEVETERADGSTETYRTKALFSSIPLTEFILKLRPHPPEEILAGARALYYRDHITVNLIVDRPALFPDNWLYIHSPEVRMARLCEYGNFSKEMLADPNTSALSVEYFCFAHEEIWSTPNEELIALATRELNTLGFLNGAKITDGFVVREKDSYPAYYLGHKVHFDLLRDYVSALPNTWMIGRGGMYKYNNQDHSMLSGLLSARSYDGEKINLWEVNSDDQYLEEKQLPSPVGAGKSA